MIYHQLRRPRVIASKVNCFHASRSSIDNYKLPILVTQKIAPGFRLTLPTEYNPHKKTCNLIEFRTSTQNQHHHTPQNTTASPPQYPTHHGIYRYQIIPRIPQGEQADHGAPRSRHIRLIGSPNIPRRRRALALARRNGVSHTRGLRGEPGSGLAVLQL